MLVDLRREPAVKLRPSVRIVTEPFSQGRAGRDILDPLIDRGVCFPDPAWRQAVDQYLGPVIGRRWFVGAFELDVTGGYSLGHGTNSGGSGARFRQRLTFMHRDVLGLATLDFILRIVVARVMGVPLVVNVFVCTFMIVPLTWPASEFPCHVIADLEPFSSS